MRLFIILIILLSFLSKTVVKMLNQLPFGNFATTDLASKVRASLVRVKMLLLVGDLIKSLVAPIDGALERFFSCVCPQMVKEALRLLEEFSTLGMVARIHCGISLGIRVWVAEEFELTEKAGGWQG